jgi:hypothetical protein
MRIKSFVLLAGIALSASALAQDEDAVYDGKWSATVKLNAAKPQTSRLEISEFAGTWFGSTGKSPDGKPCKQKKFPITVQESTASEFAFTVWGTSVSPSCPDLTIELKPVDKNSMEGTIEPGGTITLKRR